MDLELPTLEKPDVATEKAKADGVAHALEVIGLTKDHEIRQGFEKQTSKLFQTRSVDHLPPDIFRKAAENPSPEAQEFIHAALACLNPKGVIRALIASLVFAFAVPFTATAAENPNPFAEKKPAITQTAHRVKLSDRQIKAEIQDYRSYDLPNSCVVNSVLFERMMHERFPEIKTARFAVPLPGYQLRHEVVAYEIGKSSYVWDYNYGPVEIYGFKMTDKTENIARAVQPYVAAVWAEKAGSKNITQPEKMEKIKIEGATIQKAYQLLQNAGVPTKLVQYQGTVILAFRTNSGLNIYNPATGTNKAILNFGVDADHALIHILKSFYQGSGEHTTITGAPLGKTPTPTPAPTIVAAK